MNRGDARISVIVPVRNGAAHLGAALESILRQTRRADEIWVVDDGSQDNSVAVAERYAARGVHWVSQAPAGAAAARNRGIELATGDLLAFLDADDLWLPAKLAEQCAAFEADPTMDLIFGHVEQFVSPELTEDASTGLSCPAGTQPGYLPSAMMARHAAFQRVGPFETRWELGEFIAWYARARELGLRTRMLDCTILCRRLHGTNQGQQKRRYYGDYARILKAALDRRRQISATSSAQ